MATPAHDTRNIIINLFFAAALATANLQRCVLADGTSTLGGVDYLSFGSAAEVVAAFDAGNLSALAKAGGEAAFLQSPAPADLIIAKYDKAGVETSADAFSRLLVAQQEFIGIATTDTDTADLLALATAVEADQKHLCVIRTTDVTGLPAALAAIAAFNYTYVVYHETAEQAQFAHLASRCSYNPARFFAMGPGKVKGMTANALITTGVSNALLADNISYLAKFGTAPLWLADVLMQSGKTFEEMVTEIYIERRLRERTAQFIQTYSALGLGIPVGTEGTVGSDGQRLVAGDVVLPVMEEMEAVGRIVDFTLTYPAISATDVATENIPIQLQVTLAKSLRKVTINAFFVN